jgi:hypothetical protein
MILLVPTHWISNRFYDLPKSILSTSLGIGLSGKYQCLVSFKEGVFAGNGRFGIDQIGCIVARSTFFALITIGTSHCHI